MLLLLFQADAGGPVTFTYTGTGGAITDGAASTSKTKVFTPSGGAVAAGAATVSKTKSFIASGGATTDGTATVSKTKEFTPSGGADTAGTASTSFQSAGTATYAYLGGGGANTAGDAFYAFLAAALAPVVDQPSGGFHWSVRYERELAKRLRRKIQLEDEADAVEAALEAAGVELPATVTDARGDDLKRLRGLVNAFSAYADESANRTQRAIEYAQRAKTQLAYELAIREIAQQLEDEEHAVLLTLAMI